MSQLDSLNIMYMSNDEIPNGGPQYLKVFLPSICARKDYVESYLHGVPCIILKYKNIAEKVIQYTRSNFVYMFIHASSNIIVVDVF